jgi:hypothetical protein
LVLYVGNVDPVELSARIVSDQPKLELFRDIVEETVKLYVKVHAHEVISDPDIFTEQICAEVMKACREETDRCINQLISEGKAKVFMKDGEEHFYSEPEQTS